MFAPFLIMLREGLEAALIVSIVASYLMRTGRANHIPAVWVGVATAIGLSLSVGIALYLASGQFPQRQQEMFEATIGVIAVGILTSMVFWMRQAARTIKASLQSSVDAALAGETKGSFALIGIVFFAVAREGLESAFFLISFFDREGGMAPLAGALLGVAASIAAGYALYRGGVHLPIKAFFRWTSIFILFVAAGLLANALHSLHEAGIWNGLQKTAFDASAILPGDSFIGTLLSGIFGYLEAPNIGELIVYFAYLIPCLAVLLLKRDSGASTLQRA